MGTSGSEAGKPSRITLGEHVWGEIDRAFDLVHLLGPGGTILYSSGIEGDAGYRQDDMSGRDFLSLVHPDDRPSMRAELAAALATPGKSSSFRIRTRAAGGDWLGVEEEVIALAQPKSAPVVLLVGRLVESQVALNVAFRNLTQALNTLIAGDDAVVHSKDEVSLVKDMCRAIVEEGGYRFAWVGYAEHDEAKSIRHVAQWGASGDYPETVKLSWGDDPTSLGPGGVAIKTGQPAVIDDMLTDPHYVRWRHRAIAYHHRSGLAVPLRVHDEVIGFLGIYSELPSAFDESAIVQLSRLGDHLGFGIERHRDAARLAESLKGTITDLHQRLDEGERRQLLEEERQRIAEQLRHDLQDAIFGIGERVNVVLGQSGLRTASTGPLLEVRQLAAKAASATAARDLKPRHSEILSLVAEGFSNREIASRLHLSENTIKTHLQTIFTKLRVRNRVEAAVFAANRKVD